MLTTNLMTSTIFRSNPNANYDKITRINKNVKLIVLNYIDDEKPKVLSSPTTLDRRQFNHIDVGLLIFPTRYSLSIYIFLSRQ